MIYINVYVFVGMSLMQIKADDLDTGINAEIR